MTIKTRNIIILIVLGFGILALVNYFGIIDVDPVPDKICAFQVGFLECENFTFHPETDSIDLSIKNDNRRWGAETRPTDYVLTELSLVQIFPAETLCSVDMSNLPPESKSLQPTGIYLRNHQTVTVTLRCTPVTTEDIKDSEWLFDNTVLYELKEDMLIPVPVHQRLFIRCRRC